MRRPLPSGSAGTVAGTSEPIRPEWASNFASRAANAFNNHDSDQFGALFAADATLVHSAWPVELSGKEAIQALYADYLWSAFPDMALMLSDGPFLHPYEQRLSVAWRVTGTHTGVLDPPGIPPSGHSIDLGAREIVTVVAGLVSRMEILVDQAMFLRQIGVLDNV